MPSIGDITAKLKLDSSQFSSGAQSARQDLSSLTSGVGSLSAALGGLGLAAVGKEMAEIGFGFLSLKEQAQIAFSTMLGSGQLAESFLKELADFAARTPFEFPDLIRAAQRLTAMGFAARDVIPMLTSIGDAAAAMGASSATIDRITLALGQMAAKGKVSAEEMRQLAETGIPVWQILADKLGITVPEAMKKAEKGLIDGKTAVKLLVDGIENGTQHVQSFAGIMEKKSKTFEGLASTLKDLGRQILGDILLPAFDKVRDAMARIVDELPKAVDWFKNLSEDTKNGALALGAVVTVGPLVVGAIVLVGTALGALLSPIGLVVAAIGGLLVAYTSNLGGIRDAVNEFVGAVAGIWSGHGGDIKRITSETWGEVRVQIIDNFERIADAIKALSALIKGDWENLGKDIVKITLSFTNSVGDLMIAAGEKLTPWYLRWLIDIGAKAKDYTNTIVRELSGIGQATLNIKTPDNVPGLPDWKVIAQTDDYLKKLDETVKNHGTHAKKAKEDLAGLREELERLSKAADFFAKEALDGMEDLAKAFASIKEPAIQFVDAFQDIEEVTKKAASAAKDLVPAIKDDLDVMSAAHEIIGNTEPYMRAAGAAQILGDQFKKLSDELPKEWNTIIDGFVQKGSAAAVSIKGFASDILNVFDTLPGKWGQALNSTVNEVNKWISFIDSAIKLVQRLIGNEQTGLGGIISGIAGIFKNQTKQIEATYEEVIDFINNGSSSTASTAKTSAGAVVSSWGKASDSLKVGLGAAAGAFASLTTAMAITGATGSKTAGVLSSLFTSTLAGIQAGLAFGPVGGAIVGGISLIGGIFGALFGGKSAAQKEQERLQLEKTRLDVQQSAQSVINAAIQGFDSALAFFDKLDEFTAPRKAKFQSFFTAMTRMMNGFFDLMQGWSASTLGQAKTAAESIAPIAEAISAFPDAFNALNGHFGLAQSAIDRFFADFDVVMNAFFARSEIWIDGISKRAQKVANRLSPAVALISAFGDAMKSITGFEDPGEAVFEAMDRVLDSIVTHITNLSLKFDKAVLKTMANFADKTSGALSIWKDATDAIRAMVNLPTPTQQDFDALFNGIERAINGMVSVADRISTDGIAKAQNIATASLSVFSSIKAGVEALSALGDYKGILGAVFDAFINDFNHMMDVMLQMNTRGAEFVVVTKIFDDYIMSGAANLAHAFEGLKQILNAAGAFFPGGSPVTITAAPVTITAAPSPAATPASAPAAAPLSRASGTTIHLNLTLNGEDPKSRRTLEWIRDTFGADVLNSTSSQFA